MNNVMLKAERLMHYENRRIGFDKAGSRDRRGIQRAKIANIAKECKAGICI